MTHQPKPALTANSPPADLYAALERCTKLSTTTVEKYERLLKDLAALNARLGALERSLVPVLNECNQIYQQHDKIRDEDWPKLVGKLTGLIGRVGQVMAAGQTPQPPKLIVN